IPDPQAESTFVRSKLRLDETGSELEALYQSLLHLRRTDPVLMDQNREHVEARTLTQNVLSVRRWRDGQERLLIVNFGDTETSIEGGWQLIFNSGASTVAGVVAPPRTATILARDGP